MNLNDDDLLEYILANKVIGFNRIYFRNGTYHFTKPIRLPDSTSISGESSENTILEFDLGGNYHLISALGSSNKDTVYLDFDLETNDSVLNVEDSSLNPGDIIYLFDEDGEKITSDWAKYSTGQIIEIESITSDKIHLKSKIRRDFDKINKPRFISLNLSKSISISNLTIVRKDQTESQTSNVYLEYVKDASVSCVRSYNSNFAHITIANSLNCQVIGSYFQDGFNYGGGGKAYGVMLQFATSECLVYNNQFDHLRHSMILQAGPNGNVISYNYSKDPYWMEVSLPANSSGDLVLHGNYPYSNLFEGNTVQNIIIDDSHGPNGKYNTFFRNRAELYGIFMNAGTNSQNFIGNEVTNSGFFLGNYVLSGSDHYEYGNNIKGKTTPPNTEEINIKSLYLTDKFDYYSSDNWPPIGLPNKIGTNRTEAENSNLNNYLTACDYALSSIEIDKQESSILVYPNPLKHSDKLNIITDSEINDIVILDLLGDQLFESQYRQNSFQIDLSGFTKGVYFVNINGNIKKIIIE